MTPEEREERIEKFDKDCKNLLILLDYYKKHGHLPICFHGENGNLDFTEDK